jgi:anaerobic magnesium-protoporphyrin IX monomethyl ester cyclase
LTPSSHTQPAILFVDGLWVEKFGIMSLIPHLQTAGFKVGWLLTRNNRRLLREVASFNPDYVAFSVTTGYHLRALAMARLVKQHFPAVKTVFGGPHVTYFPDFALEPEVDIALRGECDREFPEALAMLAHGAPRETVPNLVFGDQGSALEAGRRLQASHKAVPDLGPLAPLVEDLDSLPFPDRELLYQRYSFYRKSPYKQFIVSRGCPYDCAFCFNRKLRCMYEGKGRFVRLRSPESIVAEAVQVKNRWGMKLASFEDDLLTWDKGWLERLLSLWADQVKVPYNINATARDLTDESVVRLLKETGAWCVAFGVETGDETLRRKVLNKPVADAHIVKAGELLNRHGILFHTYNMFALPEETFEQALKTVRLNRRIQTPLARCTLFQPYPGTELGDSVAPPNQGEMLFSQGKTATLEAARIQRLQKYAMVAMRSEAGEAIARLASHVPAGPVHTAVFWASYFNVVRKYMKTGYRHLLELGVRSMTDWF